MDYACCTLRDTCQLDDEKLPDLLGMSVITIEQCSKVAVTGYPGEYDGLMYTMSGEIDKVKKKTYGTVMTYSNINTTAGQSGSPVIHNGVIAGIHVGCFDVNVATTITDSVRKWIRGKVSSRAAESW